MKKKKVRNNNHNHNHNHNSNSNETERVKKKEQEEDKEDEKEKEAARGLFFFKYHVERLQHHFSSLRRLLHSHAVPLYTHNLVLHSILSSNTLKNETIILLSASLFNERFTFLQLTLLMAMVLLNKLDWFRFVCTSLHPFFQTLHPLFHVSDIHGWSLLHYVSIQATLTENMEWVHLFIHYTARKNTSALAHSDIHHHDHDQESSSISTLPSTYLSIHNDVGLEKKDINNNDWFLGFLLLLNNADLLKFFISLPPHHTYSIPFFVTSSSLSPSFIVPTSSSDQDKIEKVLEKASFSPSVSLWWYDCFEKIQSVTVFSLLLQLPLFLSFCKKYPMSYLFFLNKKNALELCYQWQKHVSTTFLNTLTVFDIFQQCIQEYSIVVPASSFTVMKFLVSHTQSTASTLDIDKSVASKIVEIMVKAPFFLAKIQKQIEQESQLQQLCTFPLFNGALVLDEADQFVLRITIEEYGFSSLSSFMKNALSSPSPSPYDSSTPIFSSPHTIRLIPSIITSFSCTFPGCDHHSSSPHTVHTHFLSSHVPSIPKRDGDGDRDGGCPFPGCPLTSTHDLVVIHFFLTCQFCHCTTTSLSQLHAHTVTHGSHVWDQLRPLWQLRFPFVCSVCMESFETSFALLIHTRRSHKGSSEEKSKEEGWGSG